MELELFRTKSSDHSIQGKLAIDGVFECFTIERPYDDPDFKPIPEGRYKVEMRDSAFWSQHGYKRVPGICDVPGRTDIEIHPGNFPYESKGCVIVGEQLGEDCVWSSRSAFDPLLFKIQNSKEDIYITVKG